MATGISDLVVRLSAQTKQFSKKMTGARKQMGSIRGAVDRMNATAVLQSRQMQQLVAMQGKFAKATKANTAHAGHMGKAYSNAFAGMLGHIRQVITMMAAMAVVMGAATLAYSGEEFNQKMRNSLAIMGEVSAGMRGDMREAAIDVAAATRFSAGEAAEAFYYLASAGLNARQSIAALPQVAAFAQAGTFDLALATELATDAQSALGLKVKDAQVNLVNLTRVTDVLIKANTLADATTQQFSEALTNKAGPAMRTVGMQIEEGVAVLAAWADQGVKGERAGTALNIVLRDLQTKALLNRDAFKNAGVAVFDATGDMRNMADIIGDLEKHLGSMSDAQKKATLMQMGFTDRSVIFIQTLMGTSEKIREYEKALKAAGGTTKEVADSQLTPLQEGWNELSSTLTDVSSVIITDLSPAMKGMLKGLTGLLEELKVGVPYVVKLGVAMLAGAAAVWVINAAIRAYTVVQKAAITTTVILQSLGGPAAWAKLAVGVGVATATLLSLNYAMADQTDEAKRSAKQNQQVSQALGGIANQKAGLDAVTTSVDRLNDSLDQLGSGGAAASAVKQISEEFATLPQVLLRATADNRQFLEERQKALARGRGGVGVGAYAGAKATIPAGLKDLLALQARLSEMSDLPGVMGKQATAALAVIDRMLKSMIALREQGKQAAKAIWIDDADRREDRLAGATQAFITRTDDEIAKLVELQQILDQTIGLWGSLGDALKFADQAKASIQTPQSKLDDARKKIEGLTSLGLIDADQAALLGARAMSDFDRAIGGPVAKIADLKNQIYQLKNGLTDSQMAFRALADTPGMTFPELADFGLLQSELADLQEKTKLTDAGKSLTEQMKTPIERAKAEFARIQKLFANGAINEETRRRAMDFEQKKLDDIEKGSKAKSEGDGPQYAGAMEKGSADAWSAIMAAKAAQLGGKPEDKVAAKIDKTNQLVGQVTSELKQLNSAADNVESLGIEDLV